MTRSDATARAAGVAFLCALGLAAAPALADDAVAESTYRVYHQAIHAAELCEERKFDQAQQEKMSVVIDEKVAYDIGAGRRLALIEEAKSEIGAEVEKDGCDDGDVQEALRLFHAELEQALGQ